MPTASATIWFLLVAVHTASLASASGPPFCEVGFFSLAAGNGKDQELALVTYESLLDLPATPDAKRKLLDSVLATDDPFAIPSERDLIASQKRMREFADMLRQLGWISPELTGRFLDAAKRQAAALNSTEAKRSQATAATSVKSFSVGQASHAKVSPDGRYVLFGRNGQQVILDTVTGSEDVISLPNPNSLKGSHWNSDGSRIVLVVATKDSAPDAFETYGVVDGKWDDKPTKISFAPGLVRRTIDGMQWDVTFDSPLANPSWVLGRVHEVGRRSNHRYYHCLIDIEKGTFQKLFNESKVWYVIQGTNSFTRVIPKEKGLVLEIVDIVPRWLRKPTTRARQFPLSGGRFKGSIIAARDNLVVNWSVTDQSLVVVSTADGTTKTIPSPAPRSKVFQALILPGGKVLLQVAEPLDKTNAPRVRALDLSSGALLGEQEISRGSSILLSSTGNEILENRGGTIRKWLTESLLPPKTSP